MDNSWMEAILRRNQRENEVLKVLSFETDESSVPKGENYLSVIKRCKMELILASGRRKTKTLVVKEKLEGKKGDAFVELDPFKVEIKIYEDVLNQMECLMDEFDDNREKLWCQMYGYQRYNEVGYELVDRKIGIDLNHAKLYLRSIGRFHAMSKILIERGLLTRTDISPFYISSMVDTVKNIFEGTSRHLSKIVLNKWPAEWKEFGTRLEKLALVIVQRLQDLTVEEVNRESAFFVLNHGDSWTTNMLFKYAQDGIPTSIKLIDFQVSHVSSYIWDVLYFLYNSVQPKVRRSNIQDLLKIYWESLDTNLRRYGYTKYIPTLNDVFEEAEKKDLYSFVMVAFFHPGQTADIEMPFDAEKAADMVDDVFDEKVFIAPKFLEECGDDFKYFMNKGVL